MNPESRALHAGLLFTLALATTAVLAQAPPKGASAASAPQTPAVRVTTRLVQVGVVVHDGKGQPVAGLGKNDFVLYDNNEEQLIATFSVEATADKTQPAPAAPPSNTFTNRLEERSGAPTSVTVILLDELNTAVTESTFAKDQVVALLRQIKPQDRIALYVLRSNLWVLHDFTSDAAVLLRALDRHRSSHSIQVDASTALDPSILDNGDAAINAWLEGANERMNDFFNTNRAYRTLGAFEAIARHLARVPGRKNLIWVSGSFPITFGMDREQIASMLSRNRQTFTNEMAAAARTLSDADIAVYPVDARGLAHSFAGNPNFNRPVFARSGTRLAPQDQGMPGFQDNVSTMAAIAQQTGGRAFYNSNDIASSIRTAINDSRLTYVLGFYPVHQKWNGDFRHLKVRVKRDGVDVRHRMGYLAAEEVTSSLAGRDAALRAAALSPLDAAAIGLRVATTPLILTGTETLVLDVYVTPRDVVLGKKGAYWEGLLEILFLQSDGEGRQVFNAGFTSRLRYTHEDYFEMQKNGIHLKKHLTVAPQVASLRIVVRDPATGAVGSVAVPVRKVLVPLLLPAASSPRR
jgi:VWFA-related protein